MGGWCPQRVGGVQNKWVGCKTGGWDPQRVGVNGRSNVMGMGYPHGSRVWVCAGYGYGSTWAVPAPAPIPSSFATMQLNFFSNTTWRATKLTEKAKAVLSDRSSLSKKRKNDVTTGAEAAEKQTKKARAMDTPATGSGNTNSSVPVPSSPSTPSVAMGQCIVAARTAEEDIIILSSGREDDGKAKLSPEPETAEEELSTFYRPRIFT
ncbi:hypothetical protein BU15DRAFT_65038 [Melanogaster broomeanus]|nr:hypothetical protein BU15DRAFT_65038 [Melanogaster broomeanus]